MTPNCLFSECFHCVVSSSEGAPHSQSVTAAAIWNSFPVTSAYLTDATNNYPDTVIDYIKARQLLLLPVVIEHRVVYQIQLASYESIRPFR